jgi:Ca2+-binding EF-hand superfamily protein
MEGQAVPANSEVILVNAPTNTALSSSKLTYYNDFGLEYEVSGHSHTDIRKSQGLFAELQGRQTTDVPFRKESLPNYWAFLTAASPEMEEPLKRDAAAAAGGASSSSSSIGGVKPLTAILSNVREDLLARGPAHLYSFLRSARVVDVKRSNHVSYDDFRKLLLTHGLKLRLDDFDNLCRIFDPQNDKHVDYLAFFRAIRGDVKPARQEVIEAAYQQMDAGAAGSIPLTTLATTYNPASDPDVRLGKKGQSQALEQQMEKLKAVSVAGRVSKEDFVELLSIQSTYIESDDYFYDLITANWRVGQQQQQAAQPSARK